jgi:hypothetical protein
MALAGHLVASPTRLVTDSACLALALGQRCHVRVPSAPPQAESRWALVGPQSQKRNS